MDFWVSFESLSLRKYIHVVDDVMMMSFVLTNQIKGDQFSVILDVFDDNRLVSVAVTTFTCVCDTVWILSLCPVQGRLSGSANHAL